MLQPSRDLRELASAQLQSMFQILSRLSPADAHTWRACVYARRADSLEAPQIRLQRVACWPPRIQLPASQWSSATAAAGFVSFSSSPARSHDEMDDVLTLHRPAWEGGKVSTCETEASLVQEEMVLLPSSNLLVLPLAEAGVLVGLLVVDSADSPVLKSATARGAAASTGSNAEGGCASAVNEDALWCLRTAVPPLAKACAMDLRTALAGAQQAAQQQLARSLLTEARGPLKVLGTFGAMLAPRLRASTESQPESDMADGMVMQGQHLADVIAQLEAALRPAPSAATRIGAEQQLTLPSADLDWASDAGKDSFDATSVVSSAKQQLQLPGLPQQQHHSCTAVGPVRALGASIRPGLLPEHCSSTGGAGVASSWTLPSPAVHGTADDVERQQQLSAEAPHLPGQWSKPASPLQSSSRNIRWHTVQCEAAPGAAEAGSSIGKRRSTLSSGHSVKTASTDIDMQKSMDVEPVAEGVDPASIIPTTSVCSQHSSTLVTTVTPDEIISAPTTTNSNKRKRQQVVRQPVSCNLIEAVRHLLTAASRMAQVRGLRFIIHEPLQLDGPLVQPSSVNSARSAVKHGTAETVVLLPRPIRPVLVGLAAGTCRRVLGYVLDIALQCTPRGGQLCVTARQGSDGVELNVLHTGQAQPSRAHTTSKSFKPPGYSIGSGTTASSNSSSGDSSLPRHIAPGDNSIAASKGMQGSHLSSTLDSSSRLVSLDFAGQLLRSFGGQLSVVYPCHFINAISGQLDVGSNIKLLLPPAPATSR